MIFQPGSGGSGGGITVQSGIFSTSSKNRSVSFGFEAKMVFVRLSAQIGLPNFVNQGGTASVYNLSGEEANVVWLSADGKTMTSNYNQGIYYLALG